MGISQKDVDAHSRAMQRAAESYDEMNQVRAYRRKKEREAWEAEEDQRTRYETEVQVGPPHLLGCHAERALFGAVRGGGLMAAPR